MDVQPQLPAARNERLALRVLQLGALAVVLAVSIYKVFELDRFLVPKELALHVTALVAGLLLIRAIARLGLTSVDLLLIIFLGLAAISAALATNRWLGMRAFAVSASGVLLFWAARALREAGLARAVLNGAAFAVVIAAVTSLAQAYGLEIGLFAINRAPGGTLGNRNFVAHLAAIGLPLCLLAALRASRFASRVAASIGVAIVIGTLVLTRSRAAWIAAGAVMVIFLISRAAWRRLPLVILFAGAGVAAALLIPNTLRWRSDNPYLESIQNVASYDEGSGRGRLVQYERSLRMAAAHPLFGVGPGNWPVVYPKFAADNDPSMNGSEPGMTFNPWPSSDWVAFVAERGLAAAVVLAIVFITIALGALRRMFGADDLLATTLLGTLVAAAIAGAFDAVLLLAAPALLVWTTVGALWSPAPARRTIPWFVVLAVIVIAGFGAVRSAAQLVSMTTFATRSSSAALERASSLDPGNYRLHLRLARSGKRKQRCEHARAAHGLFPSAQSARELSRRCGE